MVTENKRFLASALHSNQHKSDDDSKITHLISIVHIIVQLPQKETKTNLECCVCFAAIVCASMQFYRVDYKSRSRLLEINKKKVKLLVLYFYWIEKQLMTY